jgi:hypothetical protein
VDILVVRVQVQSRLLDGVGAAVPNKDTIITGTIYYLQKPYCMLGVCSLYLCYITYDRSAEYRARIFSHCSELPSTNFTVGSLLCIGKSSALRWKFYENPFLYSGKRCLIPVDVGDGFLRMKYVDKIFGPLAEKAYQAIMIASGAPNITLETAWMVFRQMVGQLSDAGMDSP